MLPRGALNSKGQQRQGKGPAFGTSQSQRVKVAVRRATPASLNGPARGREQGRGLSRAPGLAPEGSAESLPPPSPGALSHEEAVAPLARPSLPPSPSGPGHVHPHVAHTHQLPQHQADSRRMTPQAPHLACPSRRDTPHLPPPPALGSPCCAGSGGTEESAESTSPAGQETGCAMAQGAPATRARWAHVSVQEGAERRSHRSPP